MRAWMGAHNCGVESSTKEQALSLLDGVLPVEIHDLGIVLGMDQGGPHSRENGSRKKICTQ
jgi:hypothetical protein